MFGIQRALYLFVAKNLHPSSIIEIPGDSQSEDALIERMVRSEEVVHLTRARIDVAHHDEEAGLLQVHVGIDVDNGVVT